MVPLRDIQPLGGDHRQVPPADVHDRGAIPSLARVAQHQRVQQDDEIDQQRRDGVSEILDAEDSGGGCL